MAILQKKIELDHLEKYNIKNDVLDYIAANVKSNIRELEGSLNKLIALYKLNNNNNPIDIALKVSNGDTKMIRNDIKYQFRSNFSSIIRRDNIF